MDIKPIETEYNGYRFRSRLEARWAVFFDAIELEYQYEAEGFEVPIDEDTKVMYLPDFYFPKFDVYAEVKGTDEQLHKDGERIGMCIDWDMTPVSKGLIILGDIPNWQRIGWGNIPMFDFLLCEKGVRRSCAAFYSGGASAKIFKGEKEILWNLFSYGFDDYGDDGNIPGSTTVHERWTKDNLMSLKSYPVLEAAYKKAKQARFEHGEKPKVR